MFTPTSEPCSYCLQGLQYFLPWTCLIFHNQAQNLSCPQSLPLAIPGLSIVTLYCFLARRYPGYLFINTERSDLLLRGEYNLLSLLCVYISTSIPTTSLRIRYYFDHTPWICILRSVKFASVLIIDDISQLQLSGWKSDSSRADVLLSAPGGTARQRLL